MSLIFTESFDEGLTAAQMLTSGKWFAQTTGAVSAAVGRNGSAGFQTASGIGSFTRRLAAAEQDDVIIAGVALKFSSGESSINRRPIIRLGGDLGATFHVELDYNPNGGLNKLEFYRGRYGQGAGEVLLGTCSAVLSRGVWCYVELKVKLHDTTGTVDVRMDGINVLSLTGVDTKDGGTAAVFDTVTFAAGQQTDGTTVLDDVYVCNEQGASCNDFLGDVRIECIFPNGDGANNGLTARNAQRLVSANQVGIETDVTGWQALTNCTIARTTSAPRTGSGCLEMTASAAGQADMSASTAPGTAGAPVEPGLNYKAYAYLKTAVTQRAYAVGINWYDGSGTYLSQSSYSPGDTDTTSWSLRGQSASAWYTAPSGAAYAAVVVKILTPSISEIHYVDDVAILESSNGSATPVASTAAGITSHYTTVNDIVGAINMNLEESYVVGKADNLVDTWGHNDLASAATQPVKGLMVWGLSRSDTTSPKNMATVARKAGGTEAASADKAAPQTYGMVGGAHELDPTGAAWTVASVNAAEFGVKVRP